jgi:hypothetical protein
MRRVVAAAAAFGAANGLLAAVLMHFLPITGEFTFFTYGDVANGEPLDIGRPTWWPSVLVLPLALAGFSALLGALGYRGRRRAR